ncbi:hypothetical protein B2J93_7933 [Marssonina coronariae]|uniref:Uncharacterized protein n=1 Tax=Diplocarpon coronariae TaxID=2795749 RepID=A0A218Z9X0_9HELO|nr:hypothetical protein B2J93_7933 [Marssonina coronariae]
MADDATGEADPQISFKVKTSSDGMHSVTMPDTATVLDLKTKLSGDDYEKGLSTERMRLIYSGRVMKDHEPLSTYKIKAGNTIHMVKSAQSNATQNAASSSASVPGAAPRSAAGVPTNMAAGTANNPLAGLTGARYAGHMGLPGMDMFGADGGMGAPPNEDQIATMMEDPNMQQTMNEALSNPAMVDMMMNQIPGLRDNPQARQMFNDPEFRRMMTSPEALRQAAAMRRLMGGGGGANAFPAPGVTDTTPGGAAGSTPTQQAPTNPFAFPLGGLGAFGAGAGANNPFASLFGQPGQTPAQTPPAPGSAGQATPRSPSTADPNAPNPFASLSGAGAPGAGGQNSFGAGMPPITPEMMQQASQMMQSGGFNSLFAGGSPWGAAGAASAPPPADTRPPEEIYADQLRQLNDMGFFDFDQNIAALRRSGGSVQGAIEQLLRASCAGGDPSPGAIAATRSAASHHDTGQHPYTTRREKTRRPAPDAAAEALRKLCGSSAASASFHRASFSPSPRGLLPVWRCRGDSNPLDKSDGRRVSLPLGC